MPKREANGAEGGEVCAAKRLRYTLPYLPDELLAHVFSFLGRTDIANTQTVCRRWRDVVDGHAASLWFARCNALDLLPRTGVGVLKASADTTRARAARPGAAAAEYRKHYLRWLPHVCYRCEPEDWSATCRCCTHPRSFWWILPLFRDVGPKLRECVRRICVASPPYAPLSRAHAGVLWRYDDVVDWYGSTYKTRFMRLLGRMRFKKYVRSKRVIMM